MRERETGRMRTRQCITPDPPDPPERESSNTVPTGCEREYCPTPRRATINSPKAASYEDDRAFAL